MSSLFPSRRPSAAVGVVLKKSTNPPNYSLKESANVASGSGSTLAPQPLEAPCPLVPFINQIMEKQISVLVQKLESKLPCNSGLSLRAVKEDRIIFVDGLVKLAVNNPDYVVWRLCSILGKLQKRAFSDGTRSKDVLESQLFILKALAEVLSARSSRPSTLGDATPSGLSSPNTYTSPSVNSSPISPSSPDSMSSQVPKQTLRTLLSGDSRHALSTFTSSSEYPPLDDKTVNYAFDVLRVVHRHPSTNADGRGMKQLYTWHAPEWGPLNAPLLGQARENGGHVTGARMQDNDTDRAYIHNPWTRERGIPPLPGSRHPVYADDQTLDAIYLVDVMVSIKRYSKLAVYYLSASNWPIVFDRLKTCLRGTTIDEVAPTSLSPSSILSFPYSSRSTESNDKSEPTSDAAKIANRNGSDSNLHDERDLSLLSICSMDRTKLIIVLQEFLLAFREMPTAFQGVASLTLRDAVLNWANKFPDKFTEVWTKKSANEQRFKCREMDKLTGRVFDMLNDSNRGYGNRRAAVLFPTLAALICISPDRLDSSYRAMERTVKFSNKNSFLAMLAHSLTSSTSSKMAMSEMAVFACFEITRFAFFLPPSPGEEERSLRTVGIHFALELKDFFMYPGIPRAPFYASKDPIDVDFLAYCFAMIFRFHPEQAIKDVIQVCLEPERSQAVKLSVVRALMILVVEAPKYPWQPSLDSIFPVVTPRLRSILKSCITFDPEVINAIMCPASPLPESKASDSGLPKVKDTLQLRVQIETLLPLEPRFWLFGSTDADYSFLVSNVRQEQQRSKPELVAIVMVLSATITCSLNILPGAPCYEEGMGYLLNIFPSALANAALLVIRAVDDHDLLRMAIDTLHTMLRQLTSESLGQHNQEDPWRCSSGIVNVLSIMHYATWCCVTSPHKEIVISARRCIRLLSTVECNPALPRSPLLSETDLARYFALSERIGRQDVVIGGRVAVQKHIRQLVAMVPFLTPVRALIFDETMPRFLRLTQQLERASQRKDHDILGTDLLHEWENILYMMAMAGREPMDEKRTVFQEHINPLLPLPSQGQRRHHTINQFIGEVLRLICSEDFTIRKAATEALGKELNTKLMPTFFKHLNIAIQKQVVESQEAVLQSSLLLVEQCLMVMKMIFERIDTTMLDSDVPGNCITIGLFISRLPTNIRAIRLRALYCSTVDIFLVKRHYFAVSRENQFRKCIVDIMVDWIEPVDLSSDDSRQSDLHEVASAAQVAALKLFVHSSETLDVQLSQTANIAGPRLIPRDHNRYLVTLMNVVVPVKELLHDPSGIDRISKTADSLHNDALAYELVISGIANLLKNNSELYKRYCLERCYDADIRLRVVFMKAFTRVLHLGAQFDQVQDNTSMDSLHSLCEMVRESKMISLSVIRICPPNEVETLISVLMRVFNTRHALVNFLKTLIDREVAGTESPSQLFRSNNICNRMLSVFARHYGYVYLRGILETLVHQMMHLPHGCSFELDPSKLPASEDVTRNAETLIVIAQTFVDVIINSVTFIPPVIREICHHIAEVVSSLWPESKYHAIGAFMFLRFICPAVVSPSNVDIEISELSNPGRSASIQRGLVLVAKIITNLSNNVQFGKEAYLTFLNPFLEKNVRTVTKFLSDTHVFTDNSDGEDEILDLGCDDTGSLILHQYFQNHADKISHDLLARPEDNTGDSDKFSSGKDAWKALCSTLVELMDLKPALESPTLSREDTTRHIHYQQFLWRNRDRSTDVFNNVFCREPNIKGHVFVLKFANIDIDIVNFELLLYTIFKAVATPVGNGEEFDIIFDFTSFTARSRLPIAWLRLGLELLPRDIREKWRSAYLLNISSDAHSFLRYVFYLFSGFPLARNVTTVSSVQELQGHFSESSALTTSSYPASWESSEVVFKQIDMQTENRCWTSIVLHVGNNYLRIVNTKIQELSSTLSGRTVDLIYLNEVDDIYKTSQERYLVLRRSHRGPSMTFHYSDCEVLLKTIQAAKLRSMATQVRLLPASQTSDTRAILLAVGLLHGCHSAHYVRGAAYELLTADCVWLNYPFDEHIPWRGSFIPVNPLAFIISFSKRISAFAPEMTLDFIFQWSVGFLNASTTEKTNCLQYVSPWIRNLSSFMEPSNALFDEPRVRDCIRLFIDMTIQGPELNAVLQRAVWFEIGKLSSAVLDVVIDQLIRAAIDTNSDSWRCEVLADTLIPISTIHTRAKVLTELRTILSQACSRPVRSLVETDEWKSITVLTRLSLVAGHSPRLTTQNQLYAPEIAHLVALLAGTGSLSMRLSTHGMATNLLQALHVARSDDEVVVVQLRQMLDDLTSRHTLQLFGLDRLYPSSAITLLGSESTPIPVDSLEQIIDMLIRALELGSSNFGLSNVWKARWMSLLFSIAFQASFYGQYRSFTIVSKFTDSKLDDEAWTQMLLVLKRNFSGYPQDDSGQASAALLRCVRKAIPGLPPRSRYLGSIFWLAISIIQTEQTPLFPEALQLLRVTVETMEEHDMFVSAASTSENPMVATLMNARVPLRHATAKIDELSGLSFETDFGFSLTSILWDGVVDTHLNLLFAVLSSLLKTSIRAANPKAERRQCLDAASMPLYLGLCTLTDKETYERLLEEDCHIFNVSAHTSAPQRDHGDAVMRLKPLGLPDMKDVLLAVTFVLCLEATPMIEPNRKENIHIFWAGFSKVYPDVFVSIVRDLLKYTTPDQFSHRLDAVFHPSLSETHLQAVTCAYDTVMSHADPPTLTTPSSSSASFTHDAGSGSICEISAEEEMLFEIGMGGMLHRYKRQFGHKSDPEKLKQLAACTADLLQLMLSQ